MHDPFPVKFNLIQLIFTYINQRIFVNFIKKFNNQNKEIKLKCHLTLINLKPDLKVLFVEHS